MPAQGKFRCVAFPTLRGVLEIVFWMQICSWAVLVWCVQLLSWSHGRCKHWRWFDAAFTGVACLISALPNGNAVEARLRLSSAAQTGCQPLPAFQSHFDAACCVSSARQRTLRSGLLASLLGARTLRSGLLFGSEIHPFRADLLHGVRT